jgi:predicted lipoprotein with Yx(FWY)xxD motif
MIKIRPTRALTLTGSIVAAAVLAAACSSSSKPGTATTNAPAAPGTSAATGVSIEAHSGPMGTFLTDSSGKTLYLFASDSATKSSCSGGCTAFWPPLTSTGTPKATGAAASGTITTLTRSDGSKQVVYDGHPLYYFKEDSSAGQTNGQGSDNFGAKWWLVAPSGQPITNTPGSGSNSSSGSGSSSSSGGGGGGGWS